MEFVDEFARTTVGLFFLLGTALIISVPTVWAGFKILSSLFKGAE